jgi:hypothetical protein
MSRFEVLQAELAKLRTRQAIAVMVPAVGVAGAVVYAMSPSRISATSLLTGLVALVVSPFLFHHAWRAIFDSYRRWSERRSHIVEEITALRRRIAAIFEKYRERRKGERFKVAYDLAGKSLHDLEEALSVGMYRERREVFVTAFMRAGVAIRVTASIGSPYRCAAADNPAKWRDQVEHLWCDEIRQYHNHPVHNGKARPSTTDIRTSQSLRSLLGPHSGKLRSLIICWNSVREWKIYEHDDQGRHWLCFEFDAAV